MSVPAFSASIVVILSVLISLWGGAAIVALFLRDEAARTTQLREARHLAERHAKDQAEARERLEQVLAQRDQVVAQLQAALAERDLLDRTVQGLSVPIVPVWEGILVLPLVGGIDAERAAGVLDSLLRGVEQRRARTVIIDITGVPMVDTRVAQLLVDAARAASLMGCRAVLTGIRPEVAHALVDLGADLSTLVTRADLQSGVEYALQLNHRR